MSDSEELKPCPYGLCLDGNLMDLSGNIVSACPNCSTRPSVSKEPCGELVEVGKDLARLRDFAAKNGHNRITISLYQLQTVVSALQSRRGVEESWIDELGYYVQYAFDHCDELMEKFYPSIMQDFEFDEFYMSKSLCRLQVTPVYAAASMSLVISTPDYIEWVQTMEDSNNG